MQPSTTRSRNRCRRFLAAVQALLLAVAAVATRTPAVAETLRFGGTGSAVTGIQLLGSAFRRGRPNVEFVLTPALGSPGGIKGLRAGAIDLAVVARPLKDEDKAAGLVSEAYARTPFVFVTRGGVTAARALTMAQVVSIYAGETVAWPDGTPVRVVLRPADDSETRVLRQLSPELRAAVDVAMARAGMTFASTARENAELLERLPGSFGAATLAQMLAEKRDVELLSLDGVAPNVQTLADGAYAPSMTFNTVIRRPASPTVEAFLAFIHSPDGAQVLRASGCLPTGSTTR